MATDLRRVYLSVDPDVWTTLGLDPGRDGGGEVRDWLRGEAEAIARASREAEARLTRSDWLYLADATNGLSWRGLPASAILSVQIPDAHADSRMGDKWYGADDADRKVAELEAKIAAMSGRACEAVAIALRWLWDHHEAVDMQEDRWWTLARRLAARPSVEASS